jgi:sirohydrochlorin ferrochelatase
MIVLAAHGTRDPAGPKVIEALAARVRAKGVRVRIAYADVRAPDVTTVLDSVCGEPTVVVPAFLAAGYHVRTDIPAQVEASVHRTVRIAESFGPAPELIGVLGDRLCEAGYRSGSGHAVVLAAAGSSDPRALAEVRQAGEALSAHLGTSVRVGYAATANPSVADAVAEAGGRVAVASWLLAPGLFQRRVAESGADIIAEPLGAHPRVVDLVLRRYAETLDHVAVA